MQGRDEDLLIESCLNEYKVKSSETSPPVYNFLLQVWNNIWCHVGGFTTPTGQQFHNSRGNIVDNRFFPANACSIPVASFTNMV